MRCGRLLTWAAALLLALGLAVMPAAAEIVLADTQDPYEYSYTWRVIDEGGIGWADVRMEAEVLHDQSTGEWYLACTDARAIRGFCISDKASEELPMSAYLVAGGENPRLTLKCDTTLEYQYGPFSSVENLEQRYTFQLDEPGDVLAPGVPPMREVDLRFCLSLALGFLIHPMVLLGIAFLLWRKFRKRVEAVQPLESPAE